MEKQRYTLIELVDDMGRPIDELIGYGADGELAIRVVADEWPGSEEDQPYVNVIVDGEVGLLESDLVKAINADQVVIRSVRQMDGAIVKLDPHQTVMRGVLYVVASERERLREALRPVVPESTPDRPPYLDPSHPYYSATLEAAVSAWMALYAEGGYEQKGGAHKTRINHWLKDNRPALPSDNARETIATVVNPDKAGGAPGGKK